MAEILAVFQSVGMAPLSSEALNKMVSGKDSDVAISFKILGWMSSGPVDLLLFRVSNFFKTKFSLISMDFNSLVIFFAGNLGVSEVSSWVKTEEKKFARMFALLSSSSEMDSLSSILAYFILWVWYLIYY